MDNEEKPKSDRIEAVTSTVVIFGAVLCGIGGILLQIMGIAFQTGSLFKYGMYVIRVFSINPDFIALLLQLAVFLGFATCLTSVLVGGLALRRKRAALCAGMTFLLFFSACMIALGAVTLYLSGVLDRSIQAGGSEAGSLQQNVSDYLLAMYTECCGVNGNLAPDSDILSLCTVNNQPTQLTTCFRNLDRYTYYRRTANTWVCGQLENATVNLEGVLVPNTNIPASTLTNGVKIVPIVGKAAPPTFGCGAGRALAFQYAFYVWTDQNVRPVALTALICGIIQLIALCFGLATMFITNSDDELNELSMFQETNPYANPTYDFDEQQRQRQRAMYEAQQSVLAAQQEAINQAKRASIRTQAAEQEAISQAKRASIRGLAAEQEATNQAKRASVKGLANIPKDVDDRI